ncbi:TPA: hypothetical protein ACKP5U_003273 [Pseudomonas aeruginosa]|uniref:hypothetical protein n=1 Tax=Pseudomonas aeruginosa TaxID=287 RepID=UPI00115C4D09|nr:hypothetical protein [Pseudomonas aeruginosa]KAB5413550.1 hypothetical protein F8132_04095 [Pseudomonas aeruginosa]TRM10051.1 hypothetical protein FNL64_01625 [Pseudomonas aeruginosa]HEJ2170564.1 hypothetical protein [Pseudomonas aeruginosa]HEK1445051.1 hypothetical protein [Pseudomonas aeruginosa]
MSIDWSTAPKDATHWEPDSYHVFGSWMKKEGDSWFWWEGDVGRWSPSLFISEQRMGTFEARPQESWNGQGLPPVGTVCERRTLPGGDGRYEQVRIIARTRKGFPVWENTDGVFAGISKFPHLVGGRPEFRPIRTHEQIAAEEREAGISDMQTITDGAGPTVYAKLSALYDAGYRRQEEGK